jgi:hypothetical protein
MLKTLRIKEDTHKELKDYCETRNKKIVGTADFLILEGMRIQKLKDAQREVL